jgi:hypothetical protein
MTVAAKSRNDESVVSEVRVPDVARIDEYSAVAWGRRLMLVIAPSSKAIVRVWQGRLQSGAGY